MAALDPKQAAQTTDPLCLREANRNRNTVYKRASY